MLKFRPIGARVLVKRHEAESKTKSGLYIPENAKEKPLEGEVLAVGAGRVLENGDVRPVEIKVGETILFGKYGGSEIKIDGEDYTILNEDDVLGIVEK